MSPYRIGPAIVGNLHLWSRAGKWLDIHLRSARFVRRICDPATVWRKFRRPFIESRACDRQDRFTSCEREHQRVISSLRILLIKCQKPSVGRNGHRTLSIAGWIEARRISASVNWHRPHRHATGLPGSEHDPFAIRCPDRIVAETVGRDLGENRPREIVDVEIVIRAFYLHREITAVW